MDTRFSSYETYFRDKHHAKVIAGYKNGRFLVYDPCYYSAGSGSSHRNAYDYGAIALVPVSTVARESTGGSNNSTIMITNRLQKEYVIFHVLFFSVFFYCAYLALNLTK
ncbi:hypothetical protein SNR23_07330 [Lactobacillus delbrueckii subsp. bulgaricus]|uniref:hypothetical protein n=1 Tax=Lactobacillus delbrueckii TaxID=1584 RepID=UPI000230E990|nr:hypothetical protein [Lactobacillus delbrueckii]MEE0122224.1 hypothetical protein [Streptococcus salivarius]EHE88854.1 hypothetical protein LDBUL1519_01241 [Lactobacillus delbrueckii subsp. bulgaricus CNCM I-1519]MCD5449571.1 hypothetical protein [Lactobacillus delbrueckii subsp. bulgaricus]MCH5410061.1 hypothetical protein [Lactobacillus delbrueckii]MEC3725154.1 hypothetical protein [Lactobacillus delbrueckii subsp. bulgaricus]